MAFDPAPKPSASLAALQFDNRFVRELPGDPESHGGVRQVPRACYSRVLPTPVAAPRLVAFVAEVAALLDLDPATCQTPEFAAVFAGNRLLPGMEPYACRYGGHQFGSWAGQLGDGRAINLGEVVNRRGEHWTLQLKGAGLTPYARQGDGLAVLRSSLREFLCSEAMHHLGVPTTRALSLVLTGEQVLRDMFYDGHPKAEPGAIVCRAAPSFTRFGNFEIHAAHGELEELRRLADYTIRYDFPEFGAPSPQVYAAWFAEVCRRTAALMVEWQRVGFIHGVMNTDNMSILGLTIDYGPYGWLEGYDPDWTPNTTDAAGRRYRYGAQPQVALWNLAQLANAIHPLIGAVEPLQEALQLYGEEYRSRWQTMMARKLGLVSFEPATDLLLVSELDRVLRLTETDLTLFYRRLAEVDGEASDDAALLAPLRDACYRPEELTPPLVEEIAAWLHRYLQRVARDGSSHEERRRRMHAVNPKFVLRNYLAQLAIDEVEAGDFSRVAEQLEVLRHPYDEQPGREEYAAKRPEWARHRAGCSMLSCSS